MQIELPSSVEERLTAHAKAAGYDNVERYAVEHLQAIADQPTPPELTPLSDEQLAESLAMLRESEADLAAGRTQDMREALREIADKHGLQIER